MTLRATPGGFHTARMVGAQVGENLIDGDGVTVVVHGVLHLLTQNGLNGGFFAVEGAQIGAQHIAGEA